MRRGKAENSKRRNFITLIAILALVSVIGTVLSVIVHRRGELTQVVSQTNKENEEKLTLLSSINSNNIKLYCSLFNLKKPDGAGEYDGCTFNLYREGEENRDLYCLNEGNFATNEYNEQLLYTDLEGNEAWNGSKRDTFFENEENYKKILGVLEHMYVIGSGNEKLDEFLSQMKDYDYNGDVNEKTIDEYYDGMLEELIELWDFSYVDVYTFSNINVGSIDVREQFIKTIQNYVIQTYVSGNSLEKNNIELYISERDQNGTILNWVQGEPLTASNYPNCYHFAQWVYGYLRSQTVENTAKYETSDYGTSVKIEGIEDATIDDSGKIGPFYITNKYGTVDVSVKEVKMLAGLGNQDLNFDESVQTVISGKHEERQKFYIQLQNNSVLEGETISNKIVSVKFEVNYGNVIETSLYDSEEDNAKRFMYVDKTYKDEIVEWNNIPEDYGQSVIITVPDRETGIYSNGKTAIYQIYNPYGVKVQLVRLYKNGDIYDTISNYEICTSKTPIETYELSKATTETTGFQIKVNEDIGDDKFTAVFSIEYDAIKPGEYENDEVIWSNYLWNENPVNIVGEINNWVEERVIVYPSLTGDNGVAKNLLKDADGQLQDVYCIRPGTGMQTEYSIYDIYNLSDNEIFRIFKDEKHYRHFLWVLDKMYVLNSGEIDDFLNELGEEAKDLYYSWDTDDSVTGELRSVAWENAPQTSAGWSQFDGKPVNMYFRDILIKTIQSYILNTCIKRGGDALINVEEDYCNIELWPNYNGEPKNLKEYPNSYKLAKLIWAYLGNEDNIATDAEIQKMRNIYSTQPTSVEDALNQYHEYAEIYGNSVDISMNNVTVQPNGLIGPFRIEKLNNDLDVRSVKIGIENFEMRNTKTNNINSIKGPEYGEEAQYEIVHRISNESEEYEPFTLSGENAGEEFYINLTDIRLIKNLSNQEFKVDFDIDYGNIINTLLLYADSQVNGTQDLINIEKVHKSTTRTWSTSTNADIALKKYIYKIDGNLVDSRLEKEDIDTSTIESTGNAVYNMKKTPLEVELGSTITYAIRLFNEGNVDGTATIIADYIPNGLEIVKAYKEDGTELDLTYIDVSSRQNVYIQNPLDESNLEDDYISAFEEEDNGETLWNKSKVIYVECKVTGKYEGIYTNVAEIIKYEWENSICKDKDSEGNNLSTELSIVPSKRNEDTWKNYSGIDDEGNKINDTNDHSRSWVTDNIKHPFRGNEDDDDFDKIYVKEGIDLALTKRIDAVYDAENVNKTSVLKSDNLASNDGAEKDRTVVSVTKDFVDNEETNLKYSMNKVPATVTVGQKVVSTITVYNEGKQNAIVKQITDYLPKGLKLDSVATEDLNQYKGVNNVQVQEASSTGYILININGDNGVELPALDYSRLESLDFNLAVGGEISFPLQDNYTPSSYTVYIVAEATGENNFFDGDNIIYNSAAITNYGYKKQIGEELKYIEASGKGVDRDSNEVVEKVEGQGGLKKTHQTKHSNESSSKTVNEMEVIYKNNLHVEDDDDVDCIRVVPNKKFDLALRKFIYQVTGKEELNKGQLVNREPILDDGSIFGKSSLDTLTGDEGTTATYYHRKNAVEVSKGDEIIYKIRVYNEGAEGDYAGVATEITDYLPEGLHFERLADGYDSDWSATWDDTLVTPSTQNEDSSPYNQTETMKYTVLKLENLNVQESSVTGFRELTDNSKVLKPGSIEAIVKGTLQEGDLPYQEVGVVCSIHEEAIGKLITNRAAITEHMACNDNGEEIQIAYSDIDSDPGRLKNPNDVNLEGIEPGSDEEHVKMNTPRLGNWYKEHIVNEEFPKLYYEGEEDDDDFETVKVLVPGEYTLNFLKLNYKDTDPRTNYSGIDYLYSQDVADAEYLVYQYKDADTTSFTILNRAPTKKYMVVTKDNGYISIYDGEEDKKGDPIIGNPFEKVEINSLKPDIYVVKEVKAPEGYDNGFGTNTYGLIVNKAVQNGEYIVETRHEYLGGMGSGNKENIVNPGFELKWYLPDYEDNISYTVKNDNGVRVLNGDGSKFYYRMNHIQTYPSAVRIDYTYKNAEVDTDNMVVFSFAESPKSSPQTRTVQFKKKWSNITEEEAQTYTVTVQLMKEVNGVKVKATDISGKEVKPVTIEYGETGEFTNIPVYDDNNNLIEYTVEEISVQKTVDGIVVDVPTTNFEITVQ